MSSRSSWLRTFCVAFPPVISWATNPCCPGNWQGTAVCFSSWPSMYWLGAGEPCAHLLDHFHGKKSQLEKHRASSHATPHCTQLWCHLSMQPACGKKGAVAYIKIQLAYWGNSVETFTSQLLILGSSASWFRVKEERNNRVSFFVL